VLSKKLTEEIDENTKDKDSNPTPQRKRNNSVGPRCTNHNSVEIG
jgi:hypothetical protein